MPRLRVIDPAAATGKAKEIFDGPLRGKHLNVFKGLANSPPVLQGYLAFNATLAEGEFSPADREVIALTIGQANNCDYCVAAHTGLARQAGLSREQAIAARARRLDDPKLGALMRFVLALHDKRGTLSDQDVAEFKNAGYNDGQVVEAVAVYALNVFTNYFNHVNQTDIDLPAAPKID